jgi:thymidylate kinase
MKYNLICISGPDGTGKTTQASLLMDSLKESGSSYEYRWLRFHHLISLPVLGLARLMGLSEMVTLDNGEKIGYHYFYRSRVISNLYKASMFLDTLLYTIYNVYIPINLLNKHLVCDRFIYDTLVDLAISTGDFKINESITGKLLLKLLPGDSKFLVLITDEKTLQKRRYELSQDQNLKLKIQLYKTIAEEFDLPQIDASLPIATINEKLTKM